MRNRVVELVVRVAIFKTNKRDKSLRAQAENEVIEALEAAEMNASVISVGADDNMSPDAIPEHVQIIERMFR